MTEIKKFIGIIFTSAAILGVLFIGVKFFNKNRPVDSAQKLAATPASGDVGCDNSKGATSTTATATDSGVCPVKKPN